MNLMSSPLVSVLLPVYNGAAYLRDSIRSILHQTYVNFELIVIDDGSGDGSSSVVSEFEDRRVRFYAQRNRGLSYTLNRAVRLSKGQYLARQDQDDIAFPDRLEKQVSFLNRHPNVAVLGGAMTCIDGRGEQLGFVFRYPTDEKAIKKTLLSGSCIAHPTVMMRRDAIRAMKGYRRAFLLAEDYDLWLRMAERYDLANLPDILLSYRIHQNQATFRRVEQQVLSTVAAQAAAKLRRSTGLDPLDNVQRVTRAMLIKLGVSALAIRDALAPNYIVRATWMLHSAKNELANQLLARAREIDPNYVDHFALTYGFSFGYGGAKELSLLLGAFPSQEENARKRATGNFYLGRARAYFRDRRLLEGIRSAITACILQPALLRKSIPWDVRQFLRRVTGPV